MNGFKRKKIQNLTLGERLKRIRARKRISIKEVSKRTRIQTNYLEFLEEGEYDKLPADVYVKGFLKELADYANISESSLLKLYQKERRIKKNINQTGKKRKRKSFKILPFAITPKILSISLLLIVGASLIFYLYTKLDNFISVPYVVILSPEKNELSVNNNKITVYGKTDRNNKVFINEQSVLVENAGEFRNEITLKNGVNVIVIKAINKFDKSIEKIISVEYQNN